MFIFIYSSHTAAPSPGVLVSAEPDSCLVHITYIQLHTDTLILPAVKLTGDAIYCQINALTVHVTCPITGLGKINGKNTQVHTHMVWCCIEKVTYMLEDRCVNT